MTTSITPEVYERKRNELVQLLDEVIALLRDLPVIPANREKVLDELTRTRRRVFENQFTIALMARFQGGKSTTFNALCDGLEISPRGTNIKTSATVVTARNTLDDSEAGTAEVFWRSDRELALVFGEIVLPHLVRARPETFAACQTVDDFASKVDFGRDIRDLEQALAAEWKAWRDDRTEYDSDRLDILRIGSIICRYRNTPWIKRLRKKKKRIFPVGKVGALVRFPPRWIERFEDGDASKFTPEECAFAFIRQVDCRVRSPHLARTGSVIIDCPGLFASRYDTLVTRDILNCADAIWFLCGDKALSDSELKMIEEMCKIRADSPFFTINMMNSTLVNIQDAIRPANVASIRQRVDIDLHKEDMRLYHALLALCAVQGGWMLEGGVDKATKTAIMDMYRRLNGKEAESVEAAWVDAVEDQLRMLKVPERKEFAGFNAEGVAIARKIGGLDDIVKAVESEAIRKKAASILVHNGARRVEKELRSFEGELRAVTDDAEITEIKAHEEYERAEQVLKEFHDYVEGEMSAMRFNDDDDYIDNELAKDYFENVLVASIDPASRNGWKNIDKVKKNFWRLGGLNQDSLHRMLVETFSAEAEARDHHWHNVIKAGRNAAFNHLIRDKLDSLDRRMKESWNLIIKDAIRLQGLPEANVNPQLTLAGYRLDSIGNEVDAAQRQRIIVTGAGSLVLVLVPILLGGLVRWILATTVAAVVGILAMPNNEEIEKKTIEEFQKAFRKALSKQKPDLMKNVASQLAGYRRHYADVLREEFKRQTEQLAAMKEKALTSFTEKESERRKKAKLAREVRVSRIEPIRKRLALFQDSLRTVLPNAFGETADV
jgi:hypothetical protein